MNRVKCYDRSTRARNQEDNGNVSPTVLSFAGTGGGNDHFIVRFYEHHAQDCRVKLIRSNVAQTLGSSNANSVGVSGNNPIVLTVRTRL